MSTSNVLTLKQRIVSLEDISGGGGDVLKDLIERVEALEEAIGDGSGGNGSPDTTAISGLESRLNAVEESTVTPFKLSLTGDAIGEASLQLGKDTKLKCTVPAKNTRKLTLVSSNDKEKATLTVDVEKPDEVTYRSSTSTIVQKIK